MNIAQAKEEIKNSIMAYLMKDAFGKYKIAPIHQRPILLMGPPGIGKTAIMAQIATECQIGLVAYTITHHTRQSAIGLPYITEKDYGGRPYRVTEYTMSEIIGSVYDKIEETGMQEGILFIDEINCVSETLAPMMLQFLQAKTFGNHKVPEGWIIVAAGNPPEYNKSVRDFDIVTLDRVKKIDVRENFEVWKSYAYGMHIHGAILSYLEIKKENFYVIETTVDGKRFVTARGWEDLSKMLYAYEELGIKVEEPMIVQYLQHPKIAKDFANYYDLYKKYETSYDIEAIIAGHCKEEIFGRIKEAAFDEKVSVIGLLLSKLHEHFVKACRLDQAATLIFDNLKQYKIMEDGDFHEPEDLTDEQYLQMLRDRIEWKYEQKEKAGHLSADYIYVYHLAMECFEEYIHEIQVHGCKTHMEAFEVVKESFARLSKKRQMAVDEAQEALNHVFDFLEKSFGESQEMVIFLTELNQDSYARAYISDNGNEAYFKYNKSLLFGERRRRLLDDIDENGGMVAALQAEKAFK